eukprot:gene7898-5523_t
MGKRGQERGRIDAAGGSALCPSCFPALAVARAAQLAPGGAGAHPKRGWSQPVVFGYPASPHEGTVLIGVRRAAVRFTAASSRTSQVQLVPAAHSFATKQDRGKKTVGRINDCHTKHMSQVSNKPNLKKYIYPSETIKSNNNNNNNNNKKTSLKRTVSVWRITTTVMTVSAMEASGSPLEQSAGTLIAATHSRVVAAADAMSYGIDLFLPLFIIIVYYLLTSLKNKANRGGKE